MASSLISGMTPPAEEELDPFRYGWRFVKVTRADGSEDLQQVPLTLEDALHPREDDVIPENSLHEADRRYLSDTFHARQGRLQNGLVLSDCIIDWGRPEIGNHSPDISVFDLLRTRPPDQMGTFYLERHGGRCLLALELVSPASRNNDVTYKLAEYHQVGVPLYVIVDQKVLGGPRQLLGYRHASAGFEAIPLDEHGRLLVEPLGLYLGLEDNHVACYDAPTGQVLGDYAEISQALEQTSQALQHAEQKIRELEEKIRRLGA